MEIDGHDMRAIIGAVHEAWAIAEKPVLILAPLGVAGQIKLNGERCNGDYYIPLATTAGGLTASVNRGCKVISTSGGASVYVSRTGATRGPVFYTGSLAKSAKLEGFINDNVLFFS